MLVVLYKENFVVFIYGTKIMNMLVATFISGASLRMCEKEGIGVIRGDFDYPIKEHIIF